MVNGCLRRRRARGMVRLKREWGSIAVNSQQSTVNSQQSTIDNQQSTIDNRQSTINNQQLTINNQQLTINNQQLTINNQQSPPEFLLLNRRSRRLLVARAQENISNDEKYAIAAKSDNKNIYYLLLII